MSDEKLKIFRRLILSSEDIDQAIEWSTYILNNGLYGEISNVESKRLTLAL